MAAFSTIAAVGLGAAGIGSSIIGANRQAGAIEDAAERSDETNRYIYDDTVRRNQYRDTLGNEALGQFAGLYGIGQGVTPQTAQQQQQQGQTTTQPRPDFGGFFGGAQGQLYDRINGTSQNGDSMNFASGLQGGADFGAAGGQELYRQPGGQVLPGADNPQGVTLNPGVNPGPGGAPQVPNPAASTGGGQLGDPNLQNPRFQSFYDSPDYQLAFSEGQSAIESGAAARGGLLSGSTAKAVTAYGQDLATNTFGNYRNSLANIAGMGQQASNTITNAGQNYAAQFGNNQMAAGQANANAAGQIYGGIGQAAGFGLGMLGQGQGWWGGSS